MSMLLAVLKKYHITGLAKSTAWQRQPRPVHNHPSEYILIRAYQPVRNLFPTINSLQRNPPCSSTLCHRPGRHRCCSSPIESMAFNCANPLPYRSCWYTKKLTFTFYGISRHSVDFRISPGAFHLETFQFRVDVRDEVEMTPTDAYSSEQFYSFSTWNLLFYRNLCA